MSHFNKVYILGTGAELPGEPVTNEQLYAMSNLGPKATPEWAETKIGIKTRYISREMVLGATPPREGMECSSLAARAGLQAVERAGIDKHEIDLVLVATCTPDFPIPSTATIVQEKMALNEVAAIDIRSACSGFTQAIATAQQYLRTGYYRTILAIGAEVTSTSGNLDISLPGASVSDRVNATMMGDGAAAFILRGFTPEEEAAGEAFGIELLYTTIKSIGVGQTPGIYMPCGGSSIPVSQEAIDRGDHFHKQDFRRVLSHGPELYIRGINDTLKALNLTVSDVDLYVPHQANGKIPLIAEKLGWNPEQLFMNFERVGNTANASLPLCINELFEADELADGAIVIALSAESTKWLYGSFALRWHPRDKTVLRKRRERAGVVQRTYSYTAWYLVSTLQSVKKMIGW